MATRVTIRVPAGTASLPAVERACGRALDVFTEVDRTCTRFDASSDLMRANGSPQHWHEVPDPLFHAIHEAKVAYDETHGRFDPRILRQLVALGYDRTLPFGSADVTIDATARARRDAPAPWRPRFRDAARAVQIGPDPIDLGGIGKGLAVRWSSEVLATTLGSFLVDAGGDCFAAGRTAGDTPWPIGVEDPFAPRELVATLLLSDRAAVTSSIRLRQWVAGGKRVHHLIDPRTGMPGGEGLLSVTVVGKDPARAEVWSKALFISGRRDIKATAKRRSIAALWTDVDGTTCTSPAMAPYLDWRRP